MRKTLSLVFFSLLISTLGWAQGPGPFERALENGGELRYDGIAQGTFHEKCVIEGKVTYKVVDVTGEPCSLVFQRTTEKRIDLSMPIGHESKSPLTGVFDFFAFDVRVKDEIAFPKDTVHDSGLARRSNPNEVWQTPLRAGFTFEETRDQMKKQWLTTDAHEFKFYSSFRNPFKSALYDEIQIFSASIAFDPSMADPRSVEVTYHEKGFWRQHLVGGEKLIYRMVCRQLTENRSSPAQKR
ncbi:MAG: hypothetical protein AB1540_08780 [Bdellovibrionota bacterium]